MEFLGGYFVIFRLKGGGILNLGYFLALEINLNSKIFFSQLGSIITIMFTLRTIT